MSEYEHGQPVVVTVGDVKVDGYFEGYERGSNNQWVRVRLKNGDMHSHKFWHQSVSKFRPNYVEILAGAAAIADGFNLERVKAGDAELEEYAHRLNLWSDDDPDAEKAVRYIVEQVADLEV